VGSFAFGLGRHLTALAGSKCGLAGENLAI
jgi:hypothetical protein